MVRAKLVHTHSILLKGKDTRYGCRKCSPGRFTEYDNLQECNICPAWRYQLEQQRSFCSECDVGNCCPKNNRSVWGLLTISCPAGYYQDSGGQIDCMRCETGRFTAIISTSACTKCKKGSFCEAVLRTTTEFCPKGKYQDKTEQTECLRCQNGRFQLNKGQETCTICPPGFACPVLRRRLFRA